MIMTEEKGCILKQKKKICPIATLSTTNPKCMQMPWYITQVSTVWPVGNCLRYGTVRCNILTYNRITSHITCEITIITNTNCPNHRTVTSKVTLQKWSIESSCLIKVMTEWFLLLLNAILHDRPFITCKSQHAQSGRRTSFGRRCGSSSSFCRAPGS